MKKYELTQEQINQLAEKKHAKELLQKFIPDAFEAKLEVGKWYKVYYKEGYCLFNFQEYSDEKKTKNYGFTNTKMHNYGWAEEGIAVYERNKNIPATEEEVREALINEAIKRGYKKGVKCKFGTSKEIRTIETNDFVFKLEYNTLGIKLKKGNADIIFRSGKWAEIIEQSEPTKEEINRVCSQLTFKILAEFSTSTEKD